RRILEFARRESSREFEPVDLSELLTSTIEIARPKWQSKSSKAKIEVRSRCGEPVYVMGELAELREVVLNLVFNAVDAMPEGGTMELGTRADAESGCFWVADTGNGMSPETAARIFEPFFTTKGKSGTGLGLSASHGIISRHKGDISVVSEPGDGTRFEVRLPICDKASRYIKKSGPVADGDS
ncbi:MAG: HAMP domain-containing sensor histidine kinase, partial [Acidobacteriota bacterium]